MHRINACRLFIFSETSYGNGVFNQRMTNDTATFAAGLNTVLDLMIQIGSYKELIESCEEYRQLYLVEASAGEEEIAI